MNFEDAKSAALRLLISKGAARNSELIEAVGGDAALFDRVREDLIFNDLAEDKKGVGLIYVGPEASSARQRESATPQQAASESESARESSRTEHSPRKIFISYGRADAHDLALQLYRDLKQRDHRVWLDRFEIESGADWEECIEKGILSSDIFIALLTPHAVRRPDGVCLDEISLARYNSRRIIPAMVMQCRPPLGIYRLDWVDFQDWQNPARYERALSRLLAAFRGGNEVEGMYARIFAALRPLDFGAEVARLTRNFTGRKWLDVELERWIEREGSRVFFITGDPGTGKSAMLAHLVHKHSQVAAYHFCFTSLADSLDPVQFVRSIAAQLATQFDDYRASIDEIRLEHIAESEPGALLRRLIADPLLKIKQPDGPVLLLVDGLDEAFAAGSRNIARVLCERLDDLPGWVRLVLSSRKEPEILDMFSRFQPHEIDAACQENLDDVATYIDGKFREPALASLLASSGADPRAVRELIAARGEGNFLYVTQAVAAIESGQIDPLRPQTFPDGLVGIYHDFFDRLFPGGQDYDLFRPLLDVIAAAREPLSAEQIAAFLGLDPFNVRGDLEKVSAFFPERDGVYRVCHKSVLDWLCGLAGRSMTYRVNVEGGHRVIADKLMAEYRSGNPDRFTLAHLPAHLIQSRRWSDLEATLTDLRFVAAKSAAGMTYEMIADYTSAIDRLPETRQENQREREREERLVRYAQDLTAYSRRWNEARIRQMADPKQCSLPQHEEIPLPEPPASDQKDSRSCSLGVTSPHGEAATGQERIHAFSQFANAQGHSLIRYGARPGFCVQQAYNLMADGPVGEAAERIISEGEFDDLAFLRRPLTRPRYSPRPALLHILEGHSGWVTTAAITPDGRLAVSGGVDQSVQVWDLASGQRVKLLKGHSGWIRGIALTADGRRTVSVSSDLTLRIWDIESGECLRIITGLSDSRVLAITPDGGRAISRGDTRSLRVWDLESGSCVKAIEFQIDEITDAALTPDGRFALLGGRGHLLACDLDSEKCLPVGKGCSVSTVAVTPDRRRAVTGGDDNKVRVWDIESGRCVHILAGHSHQIMSVAITPDGLRAVSASRDKTLRVWDIERGESLRIVCGHAESVQAVAMTADGSRAVSASLDKTVRVWDLNGDQPSQEIEGHTNSVKSVALTSDGRRAISGSYDRTLRVWDTRTGQSLRLMGTLSDELKAVAVTPDGRRVVSGGGFRNGKKDYALRVWDFDSGCCLKTSEGHRDEIRGIALTPDGARAVTASADKTLRVWDVETAQCVRTIEGHLGEIRAVALAPDGRLIVSGASDRTLRVWDIETGECLRTLRGHEDQIYALALTPDGRRAVSGSSALIIRDKRPLRVWDIPRGECIAGLEDISYGVYAVAVTGDGQQVVSGSGDMTLRLWDIESGGCLGLSAQPAPVASVALRHNLVVAGDAAGSIFFFDFHNRDAGIPLTTAVRLYRFDTESWDAEITALCECCGQRFSPEPSVLEAIRGISKEADLSPTQSPCFYLGPEAWNEPSLLSECPQCCQPLRFNPFIVDNRERY